MNSSKSVCSRQSTRSHLSTRSVHSSIQTTGTKRTSKNTSGTSGTTTRNTTSSSSTSQRGRSKSRSRTMISNNDNSNNGSTNGSTSNNIRRKSQALIHGLDELDLRVAAIIAVDHIERQSCSAPVSAGSGAVNDCNISIISNTSTTRSTKNRGRSRSTNRAHSSTSGNGNISPNKSVSGRSVTSTRSHREVRDAAIARTILLQAKSISTGTGTGTTRTSTSIRHTRSNSIGFARKTNANANSTFDDDAASVVSNYTVHDILGDLVVTDTNPDWDFDWDAKSVKSTRSRSRRSHSRSRSACTTASMTASASASASASHSRNASAPNVNVVSNLGRQPRSRSRSTSRSSPRSASKPRSTSRSSSTIRTRAKSVASTIRLPPDDRDRDRDWGKNSNTNKGETETEDLYNAFMKNLTKEQKLAHITITDTNGDADDADANANADANAATFHDGAKSEGTEMEQWALDLFQQSQGSNDDGFGAFRDTCTGVNIHTTTRIPTSTIPTSTAAARTSKSKHNAIHKPILSRFSSAPESFQLESFDPERSNVFELDSKRIHTRTHTFTTRTHTRNATAECDSFQAFAPVTTKPAPRYTFEDQNMNTKIAHVKHTSMNTSTIPKQSRSHKPFRSQPQLPGPIPTSPSRNAIAPPRRANSLPTKTTSKNSFVPVIASKVTDMTTRTQARRNANLSYNKDFPSAGATSTSTRIGTRIETSSPSGPIDSWKKHDHDTTRNSRPSTPLHFDAMDSLDNAAFDRGEFSDPFPSRDDGNGNGDFGWKGFVTSTAFETIPSGWDTEEEGDSDNDNDNGDDDDDGFFMQAHHDPLSSASTPVHVAESSSSLSNQSPFPAITNPSEWSETSPNGVAEFDSAAAKWLKGSPTRSRRGGKDKKGTFTRTKKTLFSDDLGENSDTYGISDTTGWV